MRWSVISGRILHANGFVICIWERKGAGSDWKKIFALLAEQADASVICPFDTPGTQWEIDKLISSSKLLTKTIFVLPPIKRSLWKDNYLYLSSAWERTRIRLYDKIPMFPSYLNGYTAFMVRPNFSVVELHKGPLSISQFKSIVLGIRENSNCSSAR